jgi:hypothetical protein
VGGFTHSNPLHTSAQQHTFQTPPASFLRSTLRTRVEEGKEDNSTPVSLNNTYVHAVSPLTSARSPPMRAANFMTSTPVVALDEEEEEEEQELILSRPLMQPSMYAVGSPPDPWTDQILISAPLLHPPSLSSTPSSSPLPCCSPHTFPPLQPCSLSSIILSSTFPSLPSHQSHHLHPHLNTNLLEFFNT